MQRSRFFCKMTTHNKVLSKARGQKTVFFIIEIPNGLVEGGSLKVNRITVSSHTHNVTQHEKKSGVAPIFRPPLLRVLKPFFCFHVLVILTGELREPEPTTATANNTSFLPCDTSATTHDKTSHPLEPPTSQPFPSTFPTKCPLAHDPLTPPARAVIILVDIIFVPSSSPPPPPLGVE